MCPVASGSTEIGELYKAALGGLRGHCRLSQVGLLTGEAVLHKKHPLNTVVQGLFPRNEANLFSMVYSYMSSFSS